jgi:hypothetical protein
MKRVAQKREIAWLRIVISSNQLELAAVGLALADPVIGSIVQNPQKLLLSRYIVSAS